jgi:hypothetical protein
MPSGERDDGSRRRASPRGPAVLTADRALAPDTRSAARQAWPEHGSGDHERRSRTAITNGDHGNDDNHFNGSTR